jgi:hypothetical protein
MSPKSWEEQLMEAYWDHRWRKIMEPLCEAFQRWKAGDIGHEDVNSAIDEAYKEKCLINNLVTYRPDRAAAVIQWWDREWFLAWIEENRPPADVELASVPPDLPE